MKEPEDWPDLTEKLEDCLNLTEELGDKEKIFTPWMLEIGNITKSKFPTITKECFQKS
uniref:Uncharacterized protein n=1 Tax=Rhizophora mucronata TaxID=61149 RepID=A0A2P2JE48_RHIMU